MVNKVKVPGDVKNDILTKFRMGETFYLFMPYTDYKYNYTVHSFFAEKVTAYYVDFLDENRIRRNLTHDEIVELIYGYNRFQYYFDLEPAVPVYYKIMDGQWNNPVFERVLFNSKQEWEDEIRKNKK